MAGARVLLCAGALGLLGAGPLSANQAPRGATPASDTIQAETPADSTAGAAAGSTPVGTASVRRGAVKSFGPLRVSERNPLYHLFLTPVVQGADVLPRGGWALELSSAYSNIFEYNFSDTFEQRFDLERATTVLTVRRGFGHGLELGGSLGMQHSWGGFLDPAIQGLHDLFGLPNADREKVDDGQFGLFLATRRGPHTVFLDLPSGTGVEAPRLWGAWRLAGGPDAADAVTVRATVKLPLGDHRASSRGTDLAGEVAVRRSWGGTHLHASAGMVRFGLPARFAPIMRSSAWFGSLALEQRVASFMSLNAQFFGGSRYAAGFGFAELDNLPLNLAVGARGGVSDWIWQVSFTEDVPPNSPSVDFTLDLSIGRVWSPL